MVDCRDSDDDGTPFEQAMEELERLALCESSEEWKEPFDMPEYTVT